MVRIGRKDPLGNAFAVWQSMDINDQQNQRKVHFYQIQVLKLH